MCRDTRYDVLFEPVRIGPLVAKNRFYQVPHCNGMGHLRPRALAAMRGVKAEGGWAVVSTEEHEIHPSSDLSPDIEGRIWDDRDLPALQLISDAIHEHGALAAIQLVHNGAAAANLLSRLPPLAPSHQPVRRLVPLQARAMDRRDIQDFKRWHRDAVLRAMRAGFDIICIYAGHDLSLPMHFLQRRRNQRSDEYGGSLENRARLLRELIEETRLALGDRCAVAVRIAVDELMGGAGITQEEARETIALLAELPDLWDVGVSDWSNDSVSSRFAQEGFQEEQIAFVKSVTSKPVVGVGRFTSPDSMVAQVRRGVLDLVGAARPSIADPFLPRKIEQGRQEELRECIGCNICVSGDFSATPIRCTQNATMGEEWRRGWHPERFPPRGSDQEVLVVGAGPAGLECAVVLGRRGYQVYLAEATRELGGRVLAESRLPGLAEWLRVRDHRALLLRRMSNVEVLRESRVTADDVVQLAPRAVVIATGASWRRDGAGRRGLDPLPSLLQHSRRVFTPDDIMAGRLPDAAGAVVIFDDDHYYLGSVLAERLQHDGRPVTLVTPAPTVASWTVNTLELHRVHRRLISLGVTLLPGHTLLALGEDHLALGCVYTGARRRIDCDALVPITSRAPNEALYGELVARPDQLRASGIQLLERVGDCLAPATIAAAVYSGHSFARQLERRGDLDDEVFRRELPAIDPAG